MAAYGALNVDGVLAGNENWGGLRLDTAASGSAGYELYGSYVDGAFVFALRAPDGVTIGPNTTFWFNTDLNTATGYQVFGFAAGAEFNVNFDASGVPHLYSGAAGQTLLLAALDWARSGSVLEFAVPASALGGATALHLFADVNDSVFLPNSYSNFSLIVREALPPAPTAVVGAVTLDGNLTDWGAEHRIDTQGLGLAGYEIYGRVTGSAYVIAMVAPVAIGANSTVWLNTDRNAATGFQIFGFAGGAEYNVNLDALGGASLYSGAAGETLVASNLQIGRSGDGKIVEIAIPTALIGNPSAIGTLYDINDAAFVPTSFGALQYAISAPVSPVFGAITLDGGLNDWTAQQRIERPGSAVAGYEVYGTAAGEAFVFAIKAPAGVTIGANTTVWFNTDGNESTGFQIFGATGGAEFNVNIDASGVLSLYSGDAGQTLIASNLAFARSADGTTIEFAVLKGQLGNPTQVGVLADVNNTQFLPTNYAGNQMVVTDTSTLPQRTDFTKKVAIVYSETTAARFFGLTEEINETGYSQLFMAAQNQAMMAGVPFDILTESDLKDLSKLVNYDAIVFPSMQFVKAADAGAIESTLNLLAQFYNTSLIAAGNFMTEDENGAVLPGDPYARMKAYFDLQADGGSFPVNISVTSAGEGFAGVGGYSAGEAIRTYTASGQLRFADATPGQTPLTTVTNQTVNGVTSAAVVTSSINGDRNVHFSTPSLLGDNNQLWQAIQFAVNGSQGPTVGVQLSRDASIVASRNDMDFSQFRDQVNPESGPGIYDALLPILEDWKAAYNFAGSYYINNGVYSEAGEQTIWSYSKPYYDRLLAMGNEIGTHSYSHPFFTDFLLPDVVTQEILDDRISDYRTRLATGTICYCPYCLRDDADQAVVDILATKTVSEINAILAAALSAPDPAALDPVSKAILESSFRFQFAESRHEIEEELGIQVSGAAVPGNPEKLATALEIIRFFDYMSGGYSGVGAGFPGAFGYLTPEVQDRVYIAPNMSFDFSLLEFRGLSAEQALAAWILEYESLASHAEVPVLVWPWHDYGPTDWDSPDHVYTLAMFEQFIAYADARNAEFVTLNDLAQRIEASEKLQLSWAVSGNVLTATVTPAAGTTLGRFSLDLDNLGSQKIASVSGWYAYDDDSVFTDRDGGTYAITLGAAQTDVAHITKLGDRQELISVTGDGTNLAFSVHGEGQLVIDLKNVAGATPVVTGATVVSQSGDLLTLQLGTNLIVNGSFEQPLIAAGASAQFANGVVPGWTNGSGAALEVGNAALGATASSGAQFAELDVQAGVDVLRQSLTTAANAAYQLSVDLRQRPGTAASTNTVEIWFNNALVGRVEPASATAWTTYSFTLYGTGGAANLEFRELAEDNDSIGALIDNVSVFRASPTTHNVTLTMQAAPANTAPTITSNGGGATANISIAENTTAVTTVTATDAQPGAITYSISGGADAARFAVNAATGALTFVTAPDFEVRADAGANNVYDVVVQARDGGGLVDTQALAITVTNVNGQTLNGSSASNTLTGTPEADTINGNGGNDTLNGNAGADRLNGGSGRDTLTGGADADTFVFSTTSDSRASASSRDVVTDFVRGADKIDLSAIDADQTLLSLLTNNTFSFVGQLSGSSVVNGVGRLATGAVGYHYETINGVIHTIIEGNVNSNSSADFQIDLVGQFALSASDFIL